MKLYDLLPESASAPEAARKRYFYRTFIPGLAIVLSALVYVLAPDTGWSLQALTLVFALAMAYWIYEFVILMTALDELQRLIHVTALAISGGAVCGVYTLFGLARLRWSEIIPDGTFALPAMTILYYIVLNVVSARYR